MPRKTEFRFDREIKMYENIVFEANLQDFQILRLLLVKIIPK